MPVERLVPNWYVVIGSGGYAGRYRQAPPASEQMSVRSLYCPVCDAAANRAGSPFVSEWAVASHVAGCIRAGDKLHKSWARTNAPDVDLRQTVPRLAEALLWKLREAAASARPTLSGHDQTPIAVLQQFELKLHQYVCQRLKEHFGSEGEAWWVKGVPLQIRQDCAQRRETDPERSEPHQYMYLIDLKSIMDKNWALFEEDHARLRTAVPDFQKKLLLYFLSQINEVRNRHSHPLRAPCADSEKMRRRSSTGTYAGDDCGFLVSTGRVMKRWRLRPRGKSVLRIYATNSKLEFGICGEPSSVEFCYRVGMNYVSCSPYRVPIARLAAAQAALAGDKTEIMRTA
jgi:hypothetical protein